LPNWSVYFFLIENYCHQISSFKAKMHQIRYRLRLRPDPAGGAHSAPQTS